jgi:hypothetical protein
MATIAQINIEFKNQESQQFFTKLLAPKSQRVVLPPRAVHIVYRVDGTRLIHITRD